MEEILAALHKIQRDIDEQKSAITKTGKDVTESVTKNINKILDEKFKSLEQNQEELKEKIENQEQRLHYLEKQARQRNIVFFGIAESEKSYSNLEQIVTAFIDRYFSIQLTCNEIQEARRIGKKSEKPRPITVTFTTLGRKIMIMKQKKALNNTSYYINEDYPKYVLEKRKELQEQVKIEKEKGNKAIIRYDKIIILENITRPDPTTGETETERTRVETGMEVFSENRKRNLSVSPQNYSRTDNTAPRRNQVIKKNKTIHKQNPTQSSSSYSEGLIQPGILNFLVNNNSKNQDVENNKQNMNMI